MKRTTIKDIARRLGVNPSTVSRALKDHPDIGAVLRNDIKKLAEELHYRPNQMAIQLRHRTSKLIGLIVPEVTMFFYPSVMKGIQQVLYAQGYNLIMLTSNESPQRELDNIRICAENEVAGILIAMSRYTRTSQHLGMLHDLGIPIVMFDKILEDLPFDSVVLEDVETAEFAVQHLIKTGCTRIGGLFGNEKMLITQRRLQGFRNALHQAGLPFLENLIYYADDPMDAERCARSMMAMPEPPDGIFAMTDEVIIGAMSAIVQSSRKIPEDCSVICISDGFIPYCLFPQVTFLHHDGVETGKLSANRILSLIESGEYINDDYTGKTMMIRATLKELSTTRPFKI